MPGVDLACPYLRYGVTREGGGASEPRAGDYFWVRQALDSATAGLEDTRTVERHSSSPFARTDGITQRKEDEVKNIRDAQEPLADLQAVQLRVGGTGSCC